jgi:hypothetical protein
MGCVQSLSPAAGYVLDLIDQQEPGAFAGQRVELVGTNIRSHVGQKVQVTGTMVPATGGRAALDKRLNVRSIRMMASRCDVAGTSGPVSTSQPTLPTDSQELTPERKY